MRNRHAPLHAVLILASLFAGILAAPAEAHTLTYSKAKRAAQKRADRFAHKRTRVNSLFRISTHRYSAQAKWSQTDPAGCKGCGYDPNTGTTYDTPTTESCFVQMAIRFRSKRSRRVVVRITDSACF